MVLTAQHLQMAVPRDPTSAEIAQFLSTRSGDQMMQLMSSIREPIAQAALTASMLHAPPAAPVCSPPTEKPRKALNAFVGFRCKLHTFVSQVSFLQDYRLLHPYPHLQAMANEETFEPHGGYVGIRPQQIALVSDGKGMVHHPRSNWKR